MPAERTLRALVVVVAVMGFLAVVLGALGAHALVLDAPARARFDVALLFHFVHVLAALVVASGAARAALPATVTVVAFLAGIALFCGALYARALGAPSAVATLAPIGGAAFLFGWLSLAVTVWRR